MWLGTGQQGRGVISTLNGLPKMALHAIGRSGNQRGTNSSELIAAAHAGSFALTLSKELAQAGYRPRQIDTTATVTMENSAAGWMMTQIHLDVVATVPKAQEGEFVDAALRAKASCPVSRALNANISMRAQLVRQESAKPKKRSGSASRSPINRNKTNRYRPNG
jgi:osmotically inducible protein OsmC